MYCVQYKLEGECPYYQPTRCDFTKHFYLQCYLVIIETLCIAKSVIYGIVLVKNVKSVFTLKQIYFSFPAQTAVYRQYQNPYTQYQNPYRKYQNPYRPYQNPY